MILTGNIRLQSVPRIRPDEILKFTSVTPARRLPGGRP
jgi:hypothetical protein